VPARRRLRRGRRKGRGGEESDRRFGLGRRDAWGRREEKRELGGTSVLRLRAGPGWHAGGRLGGSPRGERERTEAIGVSHVEQKAQ
jgi:hypothetical protein